MHLKRTLVPSLRVSAKRDVAGSLRCSEYNEVVWKAHYLKEEAEKSF
jgi:hypothetical protein